MMSRDDIEDGQFEDAPEDSTQSNTVPPVIIRVDPRANGTFIDDPELLEWSEPEDDGFVDEDEEDELYEEDFEDNRVDDEDWDVTERGK